MAEVLRLLVITWDPLERLRRPCGFASANDGPPCLYAPVWSLAELATEREVTMANVLGSMAGSAVVTAAAHEQSITAGRYPDLVTQQAIPDLLADLAAGSALGPVEVRLVSAGWKDIGLGAITDAVQYAFGRVDLDRSPVEVAAFAQTHLGCPALRRRPAGEASSRLDTALAEDRCGKRSRKRQRKSRQAGIRKASESEPFAQRVAREDLSRQVEEVVHRAQTVLAFDTIAARTFGVLKATLERRGTPLAEPDLRIASIVLSRGLILVTRNVRHFQRVSELTVENWIDEAE
jgi:predicted nucleic acid-binding protein